MRIADIPTSLEEMEKWSEDYEKKNMVFNETNKKVADETVRMLLFNVPTFAHGFARKIVGELQLEESGFLLSLSFVIETSFFFFFQHL
jgi:hypothetical protein